MHGIQPYPHVTLQQSQLFMTNSLILETEDLVLIVDPSWLPSEVNQIRQIVDLAPHHKPRFLLFTHSDFDHIIGYRAFPNATVIGGQLLAEKPQEACEEILEQIRQFDDDYYLVRDYPIEYPIVDMIACEDGQQLTIGTTTLTFYSAPGHNDDGIFTVVEPGGLLIAGDYVSDVEFPFIYHDSHAYMRSLDKLEAILVQHDIQRLIPGHGSATSDPVAMRQRIEESRTYIAQARRAVATGDLFAYEAIIAGVSFPRNMKKFHEANRKLLEKEMKLPKG